MHTLIRHRLSLFLPALFVVLSTLFPITAAATVHNVQITWDYGYTPPAGISITGFRLYKEGAPVHDILSGSPPYSASFSLDTPDGTFNFSLTALFSDGTESPQSPSFPFTFTTLPETFPPPPQYPPGGTNTIDFNWDLTTAGSTIQGFRFYMNDQPLCETTNSADRNISCLFTPLAETMTFSMTSFDSTGSESVRSNLLVLNPYDYPQLFDIRSVTFTWQPPADITHLTQYYFYQNGQFICRTSDSTATELACTVNIASPTASFSMASIDDLGNQSGFSNALNFATTPVTPPPSTILNAVIQATPTEGTAPLTVSFDASLSTGTISSYSWIFGDGSTGDGARLTHIYPAEGSYLATLTTTDSSGATDQDALTITVNPGPATQPLPPTAVISSSNAVGEAPLLVNFDGSGSTATNLPITSYDWSFGDGTSDSGSILSHSYTFPGTFTSELMVIDNLGLSDTATTPVIVTTPTTTENLPPVASFTATPSQGEAPLNVAFSATGSYDSDGTITNYLWNFGDGSSATGITANHLYTGSADYSASLIVTDDKGATGTVTHTVSTLGVLPQIPFNMESGEIEIDNNWVRVPFTSSFRNPVVIAGPPSDQDAEPCVIRINNVDQTGFDIRIQEWDYQNGTHAPETVSYFVMDAGNFTLNDGTRVEAGSLSGTTSFAKQAFTAPFATNPVVLTNIATVNESSAVAGRVRNITTSGFEYSFQEQEANRQRHKTETVFYVAWEIGTGTLGDTSYEVQGTGNTVEGTWHDIKLLTPFTAPPLFFAGMQTYNDSDPAALRYQNRTETGIQLKVEEEKSKDAEVDHLPETVGYLALGKAGTAPPPPSGTMEKQLTFTWDYDTSAQPSPTGFNFYMNDALIGETVNPANRSFTLNVNLLETTMNFTMTAVSADGTESAAANILTLNPDQFPQLSGKQLATFIWEFDAGQESTIGGFKIFADDILLCETDNPSVRELGCETERITAKKTFAIKSVDTTGAESSYSNSISYSP